MTDPAGGPVGRAPGTSWGWLAVLAVALALPVGATARWLDGTYLATAADLDAGVWIFKAALAALAVVALLVARVAPRVPVAPEPPPARADGRGLVLLGAVLVLGLALRVWRIDTELWLDEILMRVRYVPLGFNQLLATFDSQNHQPFYTIMARATWLVMGGADWSVRVPAVAFGVASLWAVWAFARRVTSPAESVLAALLLSVSYHHVWFSQNARGYTVMLALALPATGAFVRLAEGRGHSARLAWWYAGLMALATWTHLTAALIAVGHALALALTVPWTSSEGRRRATWPVIALGLSALLTICLYAPMLPQVIRDVTTPTMEGVSVEWTGTGWLFTEGLRVLASGIPGGLVTVAIAVVVLGIGVVSYWRQSRLLALAMFLPVVVTLVTVLAAQHNLWPRFFFFAAGFLVLAALRGGFVIVRAAIRWRPDSVAVAGACLVAFLSLLTVPRAWQPKQQLTAALDFVNAERLPGDAAVALDLASHIYLLRGEAPAWGFTTSLSMLEAAERSGGRTWVVYTLPARLRAVAPRLYEHLMPPAYTTIRVFPATVGGGEVLVLRHDSASVHD